MSALRLLIAASCLAALLSGCFGVPEGAAGTGDLVTVRYSASELGAATPLRTNQTASFDVGSGASGLGLEFERAVKGHKPGETFTFTVRDDETLGFGQRVEVNRSLADIPVQQSAALAEFQQYVGAAAVNVTFPAYGIYTGRVTNVTASTVTFRIEAEDGQLDEVPSVGAVLESHVTPTAITRRLNPVVGATFTIQPPQPFQSTPLGLEPGSYQVLGASEDKLELARSASRNTDLVGKDLRFTVTVIAITPADESIPTDGNFGVRGSGQVNGDPYAALGTEPTAEAPDDGHDH